MIPSVDVNFLAVFVAAIAFNVLGAIWYGPLFGKAWMGLMGFSKKDIDKAKKKGMGKLYFANFVSSLVMSYVLAIFVSLLTVNNLVAGAQSGFWLWLGFIAPVLLGSVIWEGKPIKLYYINAAYWLVNLIIIGSILAVWR